MTIPLKHLRIVPVALMLLFAPSAFAKEYCVAPATGCADGTFPAPQQALDAAQANAGADQVRLGEASYTTATAFTYDSGSGPTNTLALVGAGRGLTTLTRSSAGIVLYAKGEARDTFTDFRVHIVAGPNSVGIYGLGDSLRVDVDADPSVANSEGVQLIPGSVRDTRITMATSGGTLGFVGGAAATAATDGVFDSTVTADRAVTLYGGSIRNSHVTGNQRALDIGSGTVDDVVARTTGSGPVHWGLYANFGYGGTWSVKARHLTLLGGDLPGSIGIGVYGPTSAGMDGTQSVDVRSSIVRGFERSFDRVGHSSSPVGTANLAFRYSDYTPGTGTQSGPGAGPDPQDSTNVDLDPLFVDAPGGDLRLRATSPLVDAGDPAAPAVGEPAVDLDGATRTVDGNGDGSAISDMGAFEYQRRAPVITAATATPTTALTGGAIAFTAQATDPDGEDTTLAWKFDDGTAAPGASVQHAFAQPGNHLATVTATDPAGVATSTQVSVSISAPVVVVPPGVKLSALTLSPRKFRAARGTRVGFKLDAPATVEFTVTRCKAHRCTGKVTGTIKRTGKAGVNSFRFRGRLAGKTLRAGSYRLTASSGTSTRHAGFAVRRPARR